MTKIMRQSVLTLVFSGLALIGQTPIAKCSDLYATVGKKQVYLDTSRVDSTAAQLLIGVLKGSDLPVDQVVSAISNLQSDPSYLRMQQQYNESILPILGIGPNLKFGSIEAWGNANKNVLEGILLYVESPVDAAPVWQNLNKNLRSGRSLSTAEQAVLTKILYALNQIPRVQGIAFRGALLKPEALAAYRKGAVITEPSFVSTSIAYDVADTYAGSANGKDIIGRDVTGRTKTIFVINVSDGFPVSAFAPDYMFEYEVLLKPGQKFEVKNALFDQATETTFIFLNQL